MTVAAILLAAGESTRMGAPKPLLDWGGQPLIEYQVAQLNQPPVERVIAVLGYRAIEIRPLAERAGAEVLVNELYTKGRASSLRAGAAALGDDTRTVVVLNVDQPRPRSVIDRLLEVHQRGGHLITVPGFQGERGHPTILDGWLLAELRQVRERTQGLRDLVERYRESVREVPFESAVVLLDLNSREEYERARASYFAQATP